MVNLGKVKSFAKEISQRQHKSRANRKSEKHDHYGYLFEEGFWPKCCVVAKISVKSHDAFELHGTIIYNNLISVNIVAALEVP